MKREKIRFWTVIAVFLFFVFAVYQYAGAAEKVTCLKITKISSVKVMKKVKSVLTETEGIINVLTSYKTKSVILVFDDKLTNVEKIIATLKKANFSAEETDVPKRPHIEI
jgi:copper chaperone CopZ